MFSDYLLFNKFKGQSMSIHKVAAILLGILVVAVVFSVFTGSFDSVVGGFTDQLSYPSPTTD
jgi:FlaG/FlaF family flagellin (archaellin)